MASSYQVEYYNNVINQQTGIAETAVRNGNAPKAKVAYNQIINFYKKLIQCDPANASTYKDEIRSIEEKIEDLANLQPAPAGAGSSSSSSSSKSGASSSSNSSSSSGTNKSSSGPLKSSGTSSQKKDDKGDSKSSESNKGSGQLNEDELKEALEELNKLTGLYEVKKQINEWVKQVKIFQERRARNIPVSPITYHMVFTGNPGTGKTTVARLVASIYHALGICATDHTEEVDRGKLVAGYVGQTAKQTQECIDKAIGGVLFVDEAYTLKQDERDSFGQEAIDTLLKAMEDKRDELVVIAAGYENDMKRFIGSNPGLASRFKNFINFTDYNGDDLFTIAMKQVNKYQYILDSECESLLKKYFTNLYINRDANFGNARTVRNFFETLVTCQSSRLASEYDNLSELDDRALKTFAKADIEKAISSSNSSGEEAQRNEINYRNVKSELSDEVLQKLIDDDFKNDGLFDQSVVKLCVRLETILRHKYHLGGDLFSMIHSLTKLMGESPKLELLQKLRMARDAILLPEKDKGKEEESKRIMNYDEVQQAFKIIKELDK